MRLRLVAIALVVLIALPLVAATPQNDDQSGTDAGSSDATALALSFTRSGSTPPASYHADAELFAGDDVADVFYWISTGEAAPALSVSSTNGASLHVVLTNPQGTSVSTDTQAISAPITLPAQQGRWTIGVSLNAPPDSTINTVTQANDALRQSAGDGSLTDPDRAPGVVTGIVLRPIADHTPVTVCSLRICVPAPVTVAGHPCGYQSLVPVRIAVKGVGCNSVSGDFCAEGTLCWTGDGYICAARAGTAAACASGEDSCASAGLEASVCAGTNGNACGSVSKLVSTTCAGICTLDGAKACGLPTCSPIVCLIAPPIVLPPVHPVCSAGPCGGPVGIPIGRCLTACPSAPGVTPRALDDTPQTRDSVAAINVASYAFQLTCMPTC